MRRKYGQGMCAAVGAALWLLPLAAWAGPQFIKGVKITNLTATAAGNAILGVAVYTSGSSNTVLRLANGSFSDCYRTGISWGDGSRQGGTLTRDLTFPAGPKRKFIGSFTHTYANTLPKTITVVTRHDATGTPTQGNTATCDTLTFQYVLTTSTLATFPAAGVPAPTLTPLGLAAVTTLLSLIGLVGIRRRAAAK